MRKHSKQVISVLLALVMVFALVPSGVFAAEETVVSLDFTQISEDRENSSFLEASEISEEFGQEEPLYADTEVVRVSIVLEAPSTIEQGYATKGIATNRAATRYRTELETEQRSMAKTISQEVLGGETLDVVWNLTLAANIISANVPYGKIAEIEALSGVKSVSLECVYEPMVLDTTQPADPNMATSGSQIGSDLAWAAGYTGAGSRIAVIDTGIDPDHQSFDAGAFEYSLSLLEGEYDLLDAQEIAAVYSQLNISGLAELEQLYVSSKIPFGYNYVDLSHVIDHDHDNMSGHGSHVEGIAAGNAYIPDGEGGYVAAADSVLSQGVAPDAQLLVMKVFGANGGAYDSDYMAAIEDALLLGADTINLSLGTAFPGFTRIESDTYTEIFELLAQTDTVVTVSAGNVGYWAQEAQPAGLLYSDDVSMQTAGSPGTYTNSLDIASVDNAGFTDRYLEVGDTRFAYVENTEGFTNAGIYTVAGEQEFVFFPNIAVDEDGNNLLDPYAEIAAGKVVFVSRGTTTFAQKHMAAQEVGALACIVYNNTSGILGLDLTGSTADIPCVAITQDNAQTVLEQAEAVTDEEGNILYYTGKLTVSAEQAAVITQTGNYTMSDFSSWGVPGSLEMKPEITAPGGNINSVEGTEADEQEYVVMSGTSMAAPQVAGMGALLAQYLKETGLAEQEGLSLRTLSQALLMSTAEPVRDSSTGGYYPVLQQGAGLANVGNAIAARTYLLMNEDATASYADGKVKAELGDDPERTGQYSFSFTVNNMSAEESRFTMGADLFAQAVLQEEDCSFMATWTDTLAANATFIADGKALEFQSLVEADVDRDGDTDAQDAQCILSCIAGLEDGSAWNMEAADVDGDGDADSYDAYLILAGFTTSSFTVPAGQSVEVQVTLSLTEEAKAYLNESFAAGTYLQGYVHVRSVATDEGLLDVDHSIPVLGFYGNWSEPSMYDRVSYVEHLYDDDTTDLNSYTYLGTEYANTMSVTHAGDKTKYHYTINPYLVEDEIPYERGALRSDSAISQLKVSLIRNAAAVVGFAMNEEGRVVYINDVTSQFVAAYYSENDEQWAGVSASMYLNKQISSLGAQEGDILTVGMAAVPEYYENGAELDQAAMTELLESGALGEGAYYAYTFVVDDTAPKALQIGTDLETGEMIITVQDNNYVAAVAILNKSGSRQYLMDIPQQTEPGQVCQLVADVSNMKLGEYCTIMVADYAGNETYYQCKCNCEAEDYSGRIFGFTNTDVRDTGSRWVEIFPDTLYYNDWDEPISYDGMTTVSKIDLSDISAAEYVNGYVYFTTREGKAIYAAEQGDWAAYSKVSSYSGKLANEEGYIAELAYNFEDGKLYALDDANTIYTVDLISGELTKQYSITVTHPRDYGMSTYQILRQLAIDEEGNFYSVNHYGSGSGMYLFRWRNEDAVDGVISGLTPVNNDYSGGLINDWYLNNYGLGSMAWDTETDMLYMATSYSNAYSRLYNRLMVIDPETGTASYPNELDTNYSGRFYDQVVAMYMVPGGSEGIASTENATGVELNKGSLELMKGASYSLTADVYPWTLEDKSVLWSSADETVATVDAQGNVLAVGVGTTTITAASAVTPEVAASCELTVTAVSNIQFSGLVYDTQGKAQWAELETDALEQWEAVTESGSYYAGTLHNGLLIVHDTTAVYSVDPDTFETKKLFSMDEQWYWSDAASCPSLGEDVAATLLGVCGNGGYLEMLDVDTMSLSYMDALENIGEPLAAIAYKDSAPYYDYYPANNYYLMSETGRLYTMTMYYNEARGRTYTTFDYVGYTGLDLSSVPAVNAGAYASMLYDQESGLLLVSCYLEGNTCEMYALDPAAQELIPANLGSFGENVWPVVSLYQYERATDLTLRLSTTEANLFVGDGKQLEYRVILGQTNAVTFASSDEAVVTVDENGYITALKEGSATVTVTTVDVNDAGQQLQAQCQVTVQALVELEGKIQGQIVVDGSAKWVTVDLADLSYEINADSEYPLQGGGLAGDYIYGSDADPSTGVGGYSYRIDPNTFTEEVGDVWPAQLAILGVADAPAATVSYTDEWWEFDGETHTGDAYGFIVTLTSAQMLLFWDDFAESLISGYVDLSGSYDDLAAIVYQGSGEAGEWEYDYCDAGNTTHYYLILGADGTLYQMVIYPTLYTDVFWETWDPADLSFSHGVMFGELADLGIKFSDPNKLSMTMTADGAGLIIADRSGGACTLYYADLPEDGDITLGKVGTLRGAESITALYTRSEETVEATAAALEKVELKNVASVAEILAEEEAVSQADFVAVDSVKTKIAAKGGLNAVDARTEFMEDTLCISLLADQATTNGLYTVSYDDAILEPVSVQVNAAYSAVNRNASGQVTFSFADAVAIAEGGTIAVVTFRIKEHSKTEVSVTAEEVNAQQPETQETVTVNGIYFDDVTPGDWFYDYVMDAAYMGLMKGVGENLFAPEATLTRAQMVTTLYRLAGEPGVEGLENPFTDLTEDWYTDAVIWAANEGVVKGVAEDLFAPDLAVTREQAAAILYRYHGAPAVAETALSTFADGEAVSDYAVEAMAWAVESGLFQGFEDGTLRPQASLTRAQMAKLLTVLAR